MDISAPHSNSELVSLARLLWQLETGSLAGWMPQTSPHKGRSAAGVEEQLCPFPGGPGARGSGKVRH